MGDSAPGGGSALVLFGVGGVAGALLGRYIAPKHKMLGTIVGAGVGFFALPMGLAKIATMATQAALALKPVTTLTNGANYVITGGSASDAAAVGFTGAQMINGGVMLAVWSGATGAAVPAGWTASHS